MNAPIFKRHAVPFPQSQVTDDSKHNESTTLCQRIPVAAFSRGAGVGDVKFFVRFES